MTSQPGTLLFSVALPNERLEVHAFDERWIVPTARAVALIWTRSNARLRLIQLAPEDLYPLALDQCLSALASGEGVLAVNGAGRVVALTISCDAATIQGDENAVVWIDQACLSPAARAYKALMDALYQPFLARFRGYLAEEGIAGSRGELCYGLKGGVDEGYRGHKLLPLLLAMNAVLIQRSGFKWYGGITTHATTGDYHHRRAVEGRSRTLHQARLADFVDPASGERPYADAGELCFFLGVAENDSLVPERLGAERLARLQDWHTHWHGRLAARERRARELAATLALPRLSAE